MSHRTVSLAAILAAGALAGCANLHTHPVPRNLADADGDTMNGPGLFDRGHYDPQLGGLLLYSTDKNKNPVIATSSHSTGSNQTVAASTKTPSVAEPAPPPAGEAASRAAPSTPPAAAPAPEPATKNAPQDDQQFEQFQQFQRFQQFENLPDNAPEKQRFQEFKQWQEYERWKKSQPQ